MSTRSNKQSLLSLAGFVALLAFLAGCGTMKADPTDPNAALAVRDTSGRSGNDWTGGTVPDAPTGTGSGGTSTGGGSSPYQSGSTATLNVDGAVLRDFFAPRTGVYNPINIDININMATIYDPVLIGYDESGTGGGWERAMGTHHPQSDVQNSSYNGWYTINGQSVWKGFFQDNWGAIVLIIDSATSSGVGDGLPGAIGGRVYYQNFNLNYPNNPYQGPEKMCWQITAGNHDCRTFLINGNVNMGSAINPNPGDHGPNMSIGYQYLGSFSNLDRSKANF